LFQVITSATRSTSPASRTDFARPGFPDTQDPGSTHSSVITNEAALAAIETLRSAIK
jgi:hypothetical protein